MHFPHLTSVRERGTSSLNFFPRSPHPLPLFCPHRSRVRRVEWRAGALGRKKRGGGPLLSHIPLLFFILSLWRARRLFSEGRERPRKERERDSSRPQVTRKSSGGGPDEEEGVERGGREKEEEEEEDTSSRA